MVLEENAGFYTGDFCEIDFLDKHVYCISICAYFVILISL